MASFKVFIAEQTGFCQGVERALNIAIEAAKEAGEEIYSLGQIVHNRHATESLPIQQVSSIDEIPNGATVLLRAHGTTSKERAMLETKQCRLIDTMCPVLENIKSKADTHISNGGMVVFFGDAEHEEARFVKDGRDEVLVINDEADPTMQTIANFGKPVLLLSQSSKVPAKFLKFASALKKVLPNGMFEFDNTICSPVTKRHEALSKFAGWVEAMIIVGGKHSSNTRGLVEAAESVGAEVLHVEEPEEIDEDSISNFEYIGVISGTSAPQALVDSVVERLEKLGGEIVQRKI